MHDLVIIGAGIVGSSAAYHAVGEAADVVLIDAGHPGRATDDAEDRPRQRHGLTGPTSRLSGPELRGYWPEFRADLTGLFIPDVGRVDGRELAHRLRTAAERRAGQGLGRLAMSTGTAVLQPDGSGVTVRVGTELIKAGAALLAAGAWLGADPAALGIGSMITPDKGQIVHLSVPGAGTASCPVINTRSGGYFLGFDDRVVAGATHEDTGFSLVRVADATAIDDLVTDVSADPADLDRLRDKGITVHIVTPA